MRSSIRFACLLAIGWAATPALGQVTVIRTPPDPAKMGAVAGTIRLTVTPSAAVDPPLKYRLLPENASLTRGNAAGGYYRSMILAKEVRDFSKYDELLGNAFGDDAKPIPADKGKQILNAMSTTLKELDRAARRDHCNWDLPFKEEGFSMLLPEFQQSRSLARLLRYKAETEIAARQFNAAERTLQTTFAMGRDVARAPLLITGLVGVAEANLAIEQIQNWIATPASPNLFWALASFPRPFIDGAAAVEQELDIIRTMFPEVFAFDDSPKTPEQWQTLLNRASKRILEYSQPNSKLDLLPGTTLRDQAMGFGIALKVYPNAKQALIAAGKSTREVEAMPVAQVVLLHTRDVFNRLAQQYLRWWSMPYPIAQPGMEQENNSLVQRRVNFDEGVPIASLLMPAFNQAMTAFVRLDRKIAAMAVVEALRLHAHTTGKLPDSLDDIKSLPIPPDPMTGRPFNYKVVDGRGVIDLQTGDRVGGSYVARYEIELVPVK